MANKFLSNINLTAGLEANGNTGNAGQVLTSTENGVSWVDADSISSETAEKVIQSVRFGEAVSKGDPLVITGYHGSSGPAIVERADATDDTKMPAYGVALDDYAINATGLMIAVGDFNDFDTSGYSVGDTLYVAVGGGMTNVKPTGTALIQNMGIVSRSNANNGDVEIVAIGRTNDVPNLPEGRLFVGTSDNTSLTSDVVYIDDTNDRVGIGTDSPAAPLDVAFSDNSSPQKWSYTSSENNYFLQLDTNIPTSNVVTYNFNVRNNGTDYNNNLVLDRGNVGIGTTNPAAKLHIAVLTEDDQPGFKLTKVSDSGENAMEVHHGTTSALRGVANFTNDDGSVMFLRGDGDVGIGTANPATKLDVDGIIRGVGSIRVNESATGSPHFGFSQNDTQKAYIQYTDSGDDLVIQSNSRMSLQNGTSTSVRINNDGEVGIGTTSPSRTLDIHKSGANFRLWNTSGNALLELKGNRSQISFVDNSTGTEEFLLLNRGSNFVFKRSATGTEFIRIETSGAKVGNVGIGSGFHSNNLPAYKLHLDTNSAAKPSSIYWTTTSDERVKTNIREYTKGLTEINQLNPRLYDFNGKAGFDTNTKDNIGFIAQDLIEIFPEAVNTYEAILNEGDTENTELYNVDFQSITFAMINAIKELSTTVTELKSEIETLKNK